MRSLLRKPCWRSLPRRLCAGLTLIAYLAAIFGVPLPAQARKRTDQPFPCQDNPCGCQTAEECWRGCCCLTPEQRWAWAREHNVTPPSYAEKPRSHSWRTPRKSDPDQSQHAEDCPNCSPQGRPTDPKAKKKECCKHLRPGPDGNKPDTASPAPSEPAGENKDGWKLGIGALKCRGQTTLWASTGTVLPEAPAPKWSPGLVPIGWLPCADDPSLVLVPTPPDPPPRSSLL
jgi:hypothetical protein